MMAEPEHDRLHQDLLDLLVCPVSRTALRYDGVRNELISDKAQLAFPIRDGIPIMLEGEARALSEEQRKAPR